MKRTLIEDLMEARLSELQGGYGKRPPEYPHQPVPMNVDDIDRKMVHEISDANRKSAQKKNARAFPSKPTGRRVHEPMDVDRSAAANASVLKASRSLGPILEDVDEPDLYARRPVHRPSVPPRATSGGNPILEDVYEEDLYAPSPKKTKPKPRVMAPPLPPAVKRERESYDDDGLSLQDLKKQRRRWTPFDRKPIVAGRRRTHYYEDDEEVVKKERLRAPYPSYPRSKRALDHPSAAPHSKRLRRDAAKRQLEDPDEFLETFDFLNQPPPPKFADTRNAPVRAVGKFAGIKRKHVDYDDDPTYDSVF